MDALVVGSGSVVVVSSVVVEGSGLVVGSMVVEGSGVVVGLGVDAMFDMLL